MGALNKAVVNEMSIKKFTEVINDFNKLEIKDGEDKVIKIDVKKLKNKDEMAACFVAAVNSVPGDDDAVANALSSLVIETYASLTTIPEEVEKPEGAKRGRKPKEPGEAKPKKEKVKKEKKESYGRAVSVRDAMIEGNETIEAISFRSNQLYLEHNPGANDSTSAAQLWVDQCIRWLVPFGYLKIDEVGNYQLVVKPIV